MDVPKQCVFEEKDGVCICIYCKSTVNAKCEKLRRNCTEQINYPSIITMASNFAEAMVKFTLDGFKTVDKEEQERRLNICKSCPFYDELQNRCKACGCSSSLSSRIASYDCPKGYWENEKGK